jgi:hypothetical protein
VAPQGKAKQEARLILKYVTQLLAPILAGDDTKLIDSNHW